MSAITSDPSDTVEPTVHPMRPQVLALPSPTAVRSIILVGTMLSAGLFVGTWFHNETAVGDEWLRRFAQCWSSRQSATPADLRAKLLQEQSYETCAASAQTTLALYAVAGVVVVAVLGLAVAVVVPHMIERRRRLRADGAAVDTSTPRLGELASDMGLRRTPRLVTGRSTVRDAFSYGRPGRYSVVLPTAVAIRPRDSRTFDPLVRHELAHIRRRDVVLAWGARSIWLTLVPLLMAPVAWAVATSDLSLLTAYVWRAAVLVAVTGLAAAAILRGREFEADLASSDTPARREELLGLLRRVHSRELTWWRSPLANHPSPGDRRAVIADPSRLTRLTVPDGVTAAFLGALVEPLLASVAWTVPSVGGNGAVISILIVGSILGVTLGLGLWRRSVVCRLATVSGGEPESVRPDALRLALGAFVGYALGGTASLAQVSASTITGLYHPWLIGLSALALAGATVVVAALGELATGTATLVRRRTYAALCVVVSTLVFIVALWGATTLTRAVDLGGWIVGSQTLLLVLVSRPIALAALLLALGVVALTLVGARPGRVPSAPPEWVVAWSQQSAEPPAGAAVDLSTVEAATPTGSTHPEAAHWTGTTSTKDLGRAALAGVVFGAVAAGSIWLFGVVSVLPSDPDALAQRYFIYLWAYAVSALVATVFCRLRWGLVGIALGLISGVVASTVAALCFSLVINPSKGGAVYLAFVEGNVRPAIALGLLLSIPVSALLALGRPARSVPPAVLSPGVARRRAVAVGAVTALLAAGLPLGVFAARDTVAPLWDEAAVLSLLRERLQDTGITSQAALGSDTEEAAYLTTFAPDVAHRLLDVEKAMVDIDSSAEALDVRADRVRTDVIAPLEQIRDAVRSQTVTSPRLAPTHQRLASIVSESLGGATNIADGLQRRDVELYRGGATRWVAAQQDYDTWLSGLTRLGQQRGGG